ncbi:MAG: hypothetical protein BGO37_11085 [Cellulomonas sp. 73-92]|mgnify:CR=1 FL=1|uniref:DUF2079 domain-containing protein n=1 Tax=Cellulomonas sp. 73-92 TaxID=1895740 RepID=UPI0009292555|nr:DUF2079 domain-containing protein [Cellulomonas sp. 73-92]OJV76584.1 MAG: hypothetical protein BGO37_11085 [Cellulomonas sp. 73-92]
MSEVRVAQQERREHAVLPHVRPDRVLWALFVGAAAVYSVFAITCYAQYRTAGYDLGIFDQAVRAYAHLRLPVATLKGDGYDVLGDHFDPIVAAWAPLYWIWDDVRMLLVGQGVVVAAAVFPVQRFVARRVGTPWSYLLTAGFVLGWPVQTLVNFDVHEVAFAVPLLAWAVDALDRRSDRALVVVAGLLLLVREDMGLVVAVLGLLRIARAGRRWRGVVLVVGGLAVFALVTAVFMPHLAPAGSAARLQLQYSQLGSGPGGIVLGALRKPWHTLVLMVTPSVKVGTLLALLAPLAFLPLGSPYALLALPMLAGRFLSDRPLTWQTGFHYDAPVWVVLVLAAVDAFGRRPLRRARWARWGPAAVAVLLVGSVVVGPLVAPAGFPARRLVDGEAFASSARARDMAAAIAVVPPVTCVVADDYVADHLTHTNRVTVAGVSRHRQDFFVLDLSQTPSVGTPPARTTPQALAAATGQGFTEVFRSGSIVVLRSPSYRGPAADCTPDSS